MPRESEASSTPRPLGSTADVSGMLYHPLSLVTTVRGWIYAHDHLEFTPYIGR